MGRYFYRVSWTIIERRMMGVTLDTVGTVLRFSSPPVAQYQEVAARHGHSLRLEELNASFKQRWTDMNQDFPHFGSLTPGLSSIRWWHQLVKETFRSVVGEEYDERVFGEVASELYSYYHSSKPYQVFPDAVETLAELRAREVRVGAISNFDNRLHDILPSLGIAQYLHFILTSEDARSSKPDSEIFSLGARKSLLPDLQPEEILHIGDDVTNDYLGPRQLGWQSLLVDRWGGGYDTVPSEEVITNLED